jgi:S-adenosylmethionine:tRNA ribosyltransferase-isomerase
LRVDEFDYELPEELIAQYPAEKRDGSRLLLISGDSDEFEDKHFSDLPEYLNEGDLLILNNSKVVHARLIGIKESTGAKIELFLIRKVVDSVTPLRSAQNDGQDTPSCAKSNNGQDTSSYAQSQYDKNLMSSYAQSQHDKNRTSSCAQSQDPALDCHPGLDPGSNPLTLVLDLDLWEVLAKPSKRLHDGDTVFFGDDKLYLRAEVLGRLEGGTMKVRFTTNGSNFDETVEALGSMPLPPYIRREANSTDEERYQTVYSSVPGSVAAPTAGLHFTKELLDQLKSKGIRISFVTLHVGLGTFRPVKVDEIEDHHMHIEEYFISEETADEIKSAKNEGRRIICVGTTSVRTIESAATKDGEVHPGVADTNIFIYPGYEWKICDALITNFHLPKSTLLMLVSSLAGKDKIMEAYKHAIKEGYRFFSYGDAMFIR